MRRTLYVLGGLASLLFGALLWVSFAAASQFRSAFGGDDIAVAWFLVPAAVTFGGPALFWWFLPRRYGRRRARQTERTR